MPKIQFLLRVLTVAVVGVLHSATASHAVTIGSGSWKAQIGENGALQSLTDKGVDVAFRSDKFSGPVWEGVTLARSDSDSLLYVGRNEGIEYWVKYIPGADHVVVECGLHNTTDSVFAPRNASVNLGIDSEMISYPQWNSRFFPTLMRCERDFAWGYFMSPLGGIAAVGVEQPTASYSLQYIYRDIPEWTWGHRIFTGEWDLLHCNPLPARHPHDLDKLLPGERKSWILHIGTAPGPEDVKPLLSQWLKAPMVELSAYTVRSQQSVALTVDSYAPVASVQFRDFETDSLMRQISVAAAEGSYGRYNGQIEAPAEQGAYRITVVDEGGKQAEAVLYVRGDWNDYLRMARDEVVAHPPLISNSCEAFYGYYPAFLAARHFPEPKDTLLSKRVMADAPYLFDPATATVAPGAKPHRVQNFSTLAGIMAALYRASGNVEALDFGSRIGDYLASEAIQSEDGAYRARGAHYTAVIYPAKSMLELARAEAECFEATADTLWQARSHRHRQSALKAIADLQRRGADLMTEGEMTYEDGMISCAALQLGLGALEATDSIQRRLMTETAEALMRGHRCLEQNLIPDARMRGATLRYWEALDIYFSPNQVMNSPHGWSAWKIYALHYLYLLTGREEYLSNMFDTLGACVQLMKSDGHLRWGFLPDPYLKGRVCVPSPKGGGEYEYADSIVGEQYLDMINPWMRPSDEHKLFNFGEIGGAGDGTVFEIFKALEEVAITTAYLRVTGEGVAYSSDNCVASLSDGKLQVVCTPYVEQLHVVTEIPVELTAFGNPPLNVAPGVRLLHRSEGGGKKKLGESCESETKALTLRPQCARNVAEAMR